MNLIGQFFLVGSQGKVKNTVRKPHVTGWGVGGDGRCNSHILGYGMCHFFEGTFSAGKYGWAYFVACN